MREWLRDYGFVASSADPSILIKRTKHGWIKLMSYVDDQLYFGSNDIMEKHFECSRPGSEKSTGESEYMAGAMAAEHMRMLENDFENLGDEDYSILNDERCHQR
ncbi:MAG: hypothetical protein ACREOZ_01860 [Gloeomargaritales cyanobacterium]